MLAPLAPPQPRTPLLGTTVVQLATARDIPVSCQAPIVNVAGRAALGAAAVAAMFATRSGLVAGERRRARRWRRVGCAAAPAYHVEPHAGCGFGASVRGFDLRTVIGDAEAGAQLRADMCKHKLLVFKGQGELTGAEHVSLSEQLGSLDHGLHRLHPKSPDKRLLRVSNDANEGVVSVGTSGWHVDGVMLRAPFAAQTMHHLSTIPEGDTFFLGMNEFFSELKADVQEQCRRLWFVSGVGDDLAGGDGQLSLIPLVFTHPTTGDESMCFHLGRNYCLGWIEEKRRLTGFDSLWDKATATDDSTSAALNVELQRALRRLLASPSNSGEEPARFDFWPAAAAQEQLQKHIDELPVEAKARAVWRQKWEDGDLALIDNLAVAHLPSPGTQAPARGKGSRGLRVFHRTTMVDPEVELKNARGAVSVLLSGPEYMKKDTAKGAFDAPKAMRYILAALAACSPDEGSRGGERRRKKEAPARERAVKALEEGGFSLGLLEKVDADIDAARSGPGGPKALTKVLKKLMLELHPDQNPGREAEITPVFKYVRDLRTEQQNPINQSVALTVKQRLRMKSTIRDASASVEA